MICRPGGFLLSYPPPKNILSTTGGGRKGTRRATYYCVLSALDLLHQAHQEDVWTVLYPVIVQLLLRLGSDGVVGSAQGAQQLGQRGVDLGRKQGHGGGGCPRKL